MMTRKRILVAGLLLTGLGTAAAAPVPAALTLDRAKAAVAASLDLIPSDDIQYDYRPLVVRLADIDGRGTRGVVYVYTATNTGSTFEQTNNLVVMSALAPDDRRGRSAYPGSSSLDGAAYAVIREMGYANDAAEHIPGQFKRLRVVDGQIRVTFDSQAKSKLCHAEDRARYGQEPCPAPGRHTWTWRWSPGKLTRTDPPGPGAH